MNQVVAGAVGMLIVVCASLWVGYTVGKQDSTVQVRVNPLIAASCVDVAAFAPTDKTFGATTLSMRSLAEQYQTLYAAACVK